MSFATRDGRDWTPDYLSVIDAKKCIGCGRCFKVCGRDVMTLKGINEEGELVDLDDDDEVEKKIMVMNDRGACIGCGACARVCPTNCQTHVSANAAGAHMSASPFLGPS
ncbi:ferredoxin III, nif-specific [Bradyrhizobium sp. UFLA01-814]|uniref:ferredoxin III, nif-specific n=1 Tax=Bradyrhizobium sp. UFLA01-814 TaxID=3023480 RepID=UPI00398AD5E6